MAYRRFGKRTLDLLLFLGALFPFLAASIVVLVISCIVFGGRVFYLQERLGYRNKVFLLYKFATLLPEEDNGQKRLLHERQTAWGKFLRDYSLDELPQIFNIAKGEMSFVGPRPLLPAYQSFYTPEEAVRHEVKPGLTGWAQVNGRNALAWKEKMAFDRQYVTQLSFRMDLFILLKTIGVVLKGQPFNFGKGPEEMERSWDKTASA